MHEGSFPNVRIPLPVVIVIALLAVAGFWWLRTKEMDFLTPKGTTKPLPEFMTNPPDEDPTPNPVLSAQVTNTHTPPPSPDKPQLEFGDLESSPGLAEYSEHASKGADYLIRLATELEVQGQWERSLLAWERVIDSCHPSLPERKAAGDAIVRIRPTPIISSHEHRATTPLPRPHSIRSALFPTTNRGCTAPGLRISSCPGLAVVLLG